MKRILHYPVQAVTNGHLIPIGTAPIPEPLHIDDYYRPVKGQPSILHALSSRHSQAEAMLPLPFDSVRGGSHGRSGAGPEKPVLAPSLLLYWLAGGRERARAPAGKPAGAERHDRVRLTAIGDDS